MRPEVEEFLARDPVKCRTCTACCKGDQAVVLKPEWDDQPSDYGNDNLQWEQYRGTWSITIKRKPNGDCVFLSDAGCSIYDKRPGACRAFDCRRVVKALSPDQRKLAVAQGFYSDEIMKAGLARMHTLKLHDVEIAMVAMDVDGWSHYGRVIFGLPLKHGDNQNG